jgi:hypothetical protein
MVRVWPPLRGLAVKTYCKEHRAQREVMIRVTGSPHALWQHIRARTGAAITMLSVPEVHAPHLDVGHTRRGCCSCRPSCAAGVHRPNDCWGIGARHRQGSVLEAGTRLPPTTATADTV